MSSIYDNYPAVRYVDEYDKDTDEQCVRCKGNCGFIGITGMWACKGFVPMTNADRIRAMTDEELAEWIGKIQFDTAYYCAGEDEQKYPYPDGWLDWLKKEAEE